MDIQQDLAGLLEQALGSATSYAATVDDRSVAPAADAVAALARFEEDLPEDGCDPREAIALLDEYAGPATVATTGSRYFGFVTGGAFPVAVAASWLTSVWDQNAALRTMSPAAHTIHRVVRRWLLELFGLPAEAEISLVSGASMGNAVAIVAARDRLLADAGWDARADGLFGAPPVTAVVGAGVHSSVVRALTVAGFGRDRIVEVAADDQGRMLAGALPDVRGPVLVCAQAGEVNTGAFDPFPQIVSWARERGAWVHVDGAFGLWAMADPTRAQLVEGLDQADSWVTDGHKFLNVTYDSGIAIVRRGEDLRRSFGLSAAYLPAEHAFEPIDHGPQGSARARQVEIWAVLRTLGRSGIERLVQEASDGAARFAAGLAAAGLEIVNDPVLNQVLVRCPDDAATQRWIAAVQADGTCWCGPTSWQGRPAMRISVSSWRTGPEAVDRSLAAMIRCAHEVGALTT